MKLSLVMGPKLACRKELNFKAAHQAVKLFHLSMSEEEVKIWAAHHAEKLLLLDISVEELKFSG